MDAKIVDIEVVSAKKASKCSLLASLNSLFIKLIPEETLESTS